MELVPLNLLQQFLQNRCSFKLIFFKSSCSTSRAGPPGSPEACSPGAAEASYHKAGSPRAAVAGFL